jgi:plasmid stabilization system protein ParE
MRWLPGAVEDVARLHAFLVDLSPEAAARAAAAIRAGADELVANPRIGKPLGDGRSEWLIPFGVGAYVLRYRLDEQGAPVVIRVWHSREDRA